ncbi:T9SS type A sorting domain-containing protein [Chryseobacterium chendengshani]|uniref:M43 family zinc metalloprotease n=1 Tax=Chryseobacterium sp. LJ668 TaxID=2864040 RepID=UPI001C689D81|nr:M43 family zinc metalloprotease [Chryseobacterium sp. LJ668]MBW8524799.1 T9SS type A sorting domain-containing protein [Chryseobacterium sp. LJ668]QYK15180.1 T9SS type A sorting domain-containing protein [Chryseobacterium sp. LJ668]
MNTKIIFKLPFLLFVMLFCSVFAQKNGEQDKIVFGKKYTIEDLKRMNGVIRCASTEYEALLQKKDPKRMTNAQFEAWIAPLIANAQANKSQNGGIITIPVVVHVIHSGQALGVAPNITDSQVMSQITVMNNDFRRMASTPGFNTNPVGADTMIQFALAKVDPKGNPTDGIDRVNLCQISWATAAIDGYVKPLTIWDPTKYMNMWSVNFDDSSLLGYAQFPSTSGLPGLDANGGFANTDGVVANFSTFGSSDYGTDFFLDAPFDKGRTMTHEVGHFLGLRHIWGDAQCGTDYCADTPTAHDANGGCPTTIASCDNPSIYEMVQNYMDYTNDTCMNIFTINQKDRITAVMNNSPRRMELKTSVADQAIPLFANDAELKGEKSCSQTSCGTPSNVTVQYMLYNRGTSALTSAVISYSVNGGAMQTTNWTGNLAQNKYAMVNIPTGASQGSITAEIVSVNSTSDQRVGNNSSTITIGNSVPVTSTSFTFELQRDYWGSETNWNLKNSAGTTLYSGGPYTNTVPNFPALITQTWTLPLNDCYTFTINDTAGDGIYDYDGGYIIKNSAGVPVVSGNAFTFTQQRVFKVIPALVLATNEVKKDVFGIYPNPADEVLNITKVSEKAKFEIHNAVGQIVKSGEIKNNQVRVSELIKGTYIITIKDKNISESIKFIKN